MFLVQWIDDGHNRNQRLPVTWQGHRLVCCRKRYASQKSATAATTHRTLWSRAEELLNALNKMGEDFVG